MKRTPFIKAIFLVCVAAVLTDKAMGDDKTDPAVTAAKEWLALVDAENYEKSWQEAAPFFKEKVKKEQWAQMAAAARKPFGKVETRELVSAEHKASLSGAPDGEYVVIQFKAKFANKPDSVETITPMKADGVWRVSGYFIK